MSPFLRGLLNLFPLRNRKPGFSRSKQIQPTKSVPCQPGDQTRSLPGASKLSARLTKYVVSFKSKVLWLKIRMPQKVGIGRGKRFHSETASAAIYDEQTRSVASVAEDGRRQFPPCSLGAQCAPGLPATQMSQSSNRGVEPTFPLPRCRWAL